MSVSVLRKHGIPQRRCCPVCGVRAYAPAKRISEQSSTSSSTYSEESSLHPKTPFSFLNLIPEIRIKIYRLCIEDATSCPTNIDVPRERIERNVYQFASGSLRNSVVRSGFKCEEYQRGDDKVWASVEGPKTSISNIAQLPLLFVNKQIYNEVAALVYPKFSLLSIYPSVIKSDDELYGWDQTNPLRWTAMREVTSLKIIFSNELAKKFGENGQDDKKRSADELSFMPWPTIPALLQVIEDLENLESVEIVVDIYGDPSLTLGSKLLRGDGCVSWLLPFKEEVKRHVEISIGFGKSGRCSQLYQGRWDRLCKKREEEMALKNLPSISTLAI